MKAWIKEHTDVLAIIAVVIGGVWTLKSDIHGVETRLNEKINEMDRRLVRIETVLMIKGIIPQEMARKEEKLK